MPFSQTGHTMPEGSSSDSNRVSRSMAAPQSPPSAPPLMEPPRRMQRRFSTGTSPSSGSYLLRESNTSSCSQQESPEATAIQPSSSPPTTAIRRVKASENGPRPLLPEWSNTGPPIRGRTWSTATTTMSRRTPENSPTSSPKEGFLRRFESRCTTSSYASSSFTNFPTSRRRRSWNISLGSLIQLVVAVLIVSLIVDSKLKVRRASAQLQQYREEETSLIAKMTRIEQRAEKLHATLARLKEGDDNFPLLSGSAAALSESENASVRNDYMKWKKRELRLKEESKRMQKLIQTEARERLAAKYGGDSILYVEMQLYIADMSKEPVKVSIELFDTAPHAVWVWLQQIDKLEWNDAAFTLNPSHVLLATPGKVDESAELEFVEKPDMNAHETWTVGLSKRDSGGLNFFINTNDNQSYHEDDSCIGKVVGGHRALEHMMTLPKKEDSAYLDEPVAIRTSRVTTVPRHFKRY